MRSAIAVAVLASGLALAACGSTVSPATAVMSWAGTNSFSQGVTDLLVDSARVDTAIRTHQSQMTVSTYCDELFADANGENTDLLPTPDSTLTGQLSTSIDDFVHLASQCESHADDAAVLRAVVRERTTALLHLIDAVQIEEGDTGHRLGVAGIP